MPFCSILCSVALTCSAAAFTDTSFRYRECLAFGVTCAPILNILQSSIQHVAVGQGVVQFVLYLRSFLAFPRTTSKNSVKSSRQCLLDLR